MPHAPNCRVVTEKDAIRGGQHLTFNFTTFQVRAVEAYNSHHKKTECVGYIFLLDGKKVYCAGDTSTTAQMADMAKMNIDYALLPIDGVYNMGPAEAAKCAAMIGAAHVIPVHMAPGQLFDQQKAEQLDVPNRLILHPGEEIELVNDFLAPEPAAHPGLIPTLAPGSRRKPGVFRFLRRENLSAALIQQK